MIKNILVCILVLLLVNIFSGCIDEDKDDNEQVQDENSIDISCTVRLLGNNILLKHIGEEKIRYDNMKVVVYIGNDSFNISSNDFILLFGNEDKYWEIGESFAVNNDDLSIQDVLIDLYLIDIISESVIIYASNKYGEFKTIGE